MKKWTGNEKPTYLELPVDLHNEMRARGLLEGKKAAEMYITAATSFLNGGQSSRPVDVSGNDDPQWLECLNALGLIWESGDEEIKDAITRNCKAFARVVGRPAEVVAKPARRKRK